MALITREQDKIDNRDAHASSPALAQPASIVYPCRSGGAAHPFLTSERFWACSDSAQPGPVVRVSPGPTHARTVKNAMRNVKNAMRDVENAKRAGVPHAACISGPGPALAPEGKAPAGGAVEGRRALPPSNPSVRQRMPPEEGGLVSDARSRPKIIGITAGFLSLLL